MRTLVVAAGGGSDAITGAALAGPLRVTGQLVVMSYSWDRLMIDPLPGPRTATDFTGLHHLAPDVVEIVAATEPVPPAGSSLPRLAAELPVRLLLLGPARGAAGMARQIAAAAAYFHLDDAALLDVGGDTPSPPAPIPASGARSPTSSRWPRVSGPTSRPASSSPVPESTVNYRRPRSCSGWPGCTRTPFRA